MAGIIKSRILPEYDDTGTPILKADSIPEYVRQTKAWLEANPGMLKEALPSLIKGTDLKTVVVNYIVAHPDSIPEIINEQYPDLREQLNNLSILEQAGLDMAKAKFPPLGILIDAIQEGKIDSTDTEESIQDIINQAINPPGSTNTPHNQTKRVKEPQNSTSEEFEASNSIGQIPEEIYDEAIDWAYGRYIKKVPVGVISQSLQAKYGLEVNNIALAKQLKSMELAGYVPANLQVGTDTEDDEQIPDPSHAKAMLKINRVLERNKILEAEKANREQEQKINKLVDEKVKALIPVAAIPINPNVQSKKPQSAGLVVKVWKGLFNNPKD